MPIINCEVELILTWSKNCVTTNSTGEGKFTVTDTKLYVPVVTLSTQDNLKFSNYNQDLKEKLLGINMK